MKNWLRSKIWKFLNNEVNGVRLGPVESSKIHSDGMYIAVYHATGGTILEFRRIDRLKDNSNYKMYVIPDSENFSETFVKIINMEMIR